MKRTPRHARVCGGKGEDWPTCESCRDYAVRALVAVGELKVTDASEFSEWLALGCPGYPKD